MPSKKLNMPQERRASGDQNRHKKHLKQQDRQPVQEENKRVSKIPIKQGPVIYTDCKGQAQHIECC